ncbi:ribosomal protein L7/L12 [Methylomonas sp. SURF-2]|uniref:Ribosomal protein L7/L12 n=1 Tax=Methylomonas subterranea TaxID=2952225 RepID=A0ABT1TG09_9GAMM|nr:ribosomal protein L7/L12 [Methylomonas sp. SURF-2]MCQ8104370.1 ribosomal protein L7/L12 [Methylomonas sp. SURF-2]
MQPSEFSISNQAAAAADAGNLIEAIKLVREDTGLGLKEAKDCVDAYLRHGRAPAPSGASQTEMPLAAVLALRNGLLPDAVKHYRAHTRCDLKDAKAAVERYLADNPLAKQQFQAADKTDGRPFVKALLVLAILSLIALGFWHAAGAGIR